MIAIYVDDENNGYFGCMTSRDGGGSCCLLSNHVIWANSAILGEMGTELALNQASGPCLEPEGTCTAV